ncbi:MAG: hypothetical protein ACREHD_23605, partial [Pirellulales bacterium]
MPRQTITFERKRSDAERRTKQAEKFLRLFRLLELLSGRRRWNPQELAREIRCSQRELYRHIEVLGLAGIHVEFDRQVGRYVPRRAIGRRLENESPRQPAACSTPSQGDTLNLKA